MKRLLLFIILTSQLFSGHSQNTMGVTVSTEEALEGYTFFSPFSGTSAYLIDPCGRLVNQWERGTLPGLSAYFLENGLMMRTVKVDPLGPFTSASNAGRIELVDWDNNTVWSYDINTTTELSHHDAVYMPNGNILTFVWELVFTDELIEMGRDPNEIAPQGFMWSEKILELEPVGTNEANIVWQWEIKDHYIQEFDSTKQNFGIVSEHPELFNINLPELSSPNSNSSRDWNHFNAIDYNPDLDQILISTRNSDEIWIIDHSTTTAEAATHQGGKYGKGGDILYRWGNASAYDRGQSSDQKLFGQHGTNWITSGDDLGKILIFNNGNGRIGPDYSTAEVITPPQDSAGFYTIPTQAFGPENAEWMYGELSAERRYSAFLSNAQRLSNGNTLLNYGSRGEIIEVNDNREMVWEYIIPLNGDFRLTQGSFPRNNSTFRAYKFPADYPGFDNIDLDAGEPLERSPDLSQCEVSTSISEENLLNIKITQIGRATVLIQNPQAQNVIFNLYDGTGKMIHGNLFQRTEQTIDLSRYAKGFYVAKVFNPSGEFTSQKILLR